MAATREASNGSESRYTSMDYTDFAHTGPGTLAGRYLRSFWQPVHNVRDLAAGRAKPLKIMSEEFTLYRGESGEPHLVAFRCAHRGTQLSTG
jgi:5,5'-dehydrodivanillate O-demethylase